MSQTSYGYKQQAAVPGGLYDTSPHSIAARANEEDELGAVKFGMGVICGSNPGSGVKLPASNSAANEFEGVVGTVVKQMSLTGGTSLGKTDTLGVIRWGKVWVRVADGLTIGYGDQLYLITTGGDAGLFSNESDDAIAVSGKFISSAESGGIAAVELYNQSSAVISLLETLEAKASALETRVAALEA